MAQRQAVSMVSLNIKEECNTKLVPIPSKSQNNSNSSTSILKSPTENIKARLSSAEKRDVNHINVSFEKLNLKQQDTTDEVKTPDDDSESEVNSQHSPKSTTDTLVHKKINSLLHEDEKKNKINDDEIWGGHYKEIVSSVNRFNIKIDTHKTTLEQAKEGTEEIMKKLKETDRITNQLKNTNFIADKADEMVDEILKEEYMFQKQNNNVEEFLINKTTDSNGNETHHSKESKVTLEEKRKLLETLKAIDNGEVVDVAITDVASRKHKLMKELFGSTENYVRK